MKIHCATLTQQWVDEPDDGEFKWFRHVTDRDRRDVKRHEALCNPQSIVCLVGLDGGYRIVPGTTFQWLPRRAQCGSCVRLFSSFGMATLVPGFVRGQTSASAAHAIDVEAALHRIAKAFSTFEEPVCYRYDPTCGRGA